MALSIRDLSFSSERPIQNRFVVDSANSTVAVGDALGIYDIGHAKQFQVRRYDDTVDSLRFHGFANGDSYVEDSVTYVEVDYQGVQLKRATVSGSASSNPGDPVYLTSYDFDSDLKVTQDTEGQDAAGYLQEQQDGSTAWKIILAPSALLGELANKAKYPVGKLTKYTADGAITLPTQDGEAAQLTGSSSAAMTLAAPSAAFVGKRFTIYRSEGTGTHDVDYPDEDGDIITRVLADGEATTLLAISTTGYRPLS